MDPSARSAEQKVQQKIPIGIELSTLGLSVAPTSCVYRPNTVGEVHAILLH